MTEDKIKAEDRLNEDDIYAIDQALRHCSKQSAYILKRGREGNSEDDEIDFSEIRNKFNRQQILKNQEIVERLKSRIIELHETVKEFSCGELGINATMELILLQSILEPQDNLSNVREK